MTTYLVFAMHAFSNTDGSVSPEPVLRTQSKDIAEAIVAKLRNEKFSAGEGRRLLRYSSVFIQEAE